MAYYRLRYATNNGRFQPCSMVDGIFYSHKTPTAFPQNSGRLESLLKHDKLLQDEDSFFLDIWTPDSQGVKPVLFWIHGGAFVSGASGDVHNNAEELARNADMVVVSPSYRLGILGTSYFDGIPQQNCGFHDIITALEWTNKNISQFQGDASNITIGRQSSGAWYAMAIHTSKKLQHLFRKTMLFSWPGAMKAISTEQAEAIYGHFLKELRKHTDESPINAPIDAILQAQRVVGQYNHKKYKFDVPFLPSIEPDFVHSDFYNAVEDIDKKIFLQYTKDECGIYVCHKPIHRRTPLFITSLFLKRYCPQKPYKQLRSFRKKLHSTYHSVVAITSQYLFHNPAKHIAQKTSNAIVNEFDFPTPNNRTGCCHCFDLPFIFGNIDSWKNSNIFSGCNFETIKKESLSLQAKIKEFCYDESRNEEN